MPGLCRGWWLPRTYLRWSARRRLNKLDNQLPDILTILAGIDPHRQQPVAGAGAHRPRSRGAEPVEYLRVVRAISLGAPLETALLGLLAERMPTEDVDMLVTAIGHPAANGRQSAARSSI